MTHHNETGFTLVELLVSIAVASIMGGLIASSFYEQQQSHNSQLEASAVQQNLRAATFVAGREIRLSGYQPHVLNKTGTGITAAQPDDLTFSYLTDADGDGDVDDLETVNYYLDDSYGDGDNDLVRNAVNFPVAENIDGLEFFYTLADGTQTTAPTADQLDEIQAIRMTILARTENPLRDAAQNQSFNTPSGAVWGPYNDSFRRIMLSTNIICRNAGV